MHSIWILEDHPLFSLAVIQLARANGIHAKFSTFKSIEKFFERATKIPKSFPDLLILDLRVGEHENSLIWIRENLAIFENVPLFVLTQSHSSFSHSLSKSLGAKGYLPKDARPEQIIEGIRVCLRNEEYFEFAPQDLSSSPKITEREKEILLHLSLGMSARESAALLHMSHRTAEVHRKNLCVKMNAKNAVDLVRIAIQAGILP